VERVQRASDQPKRRDGVSCRPFRHKRRQLPLDRHAQCALARGPRRLPHGRARGRQLQRALQRVSHQQQRHVRVSIKPDGYGRHDKQQPGTLVAFPRGRAHARGANGRSGAAASKWRDHQQHHRRSRTRPIRAPRVSRQLGRSRH
jgi:hypothetical protein